MKREEKIAEARRLRAEGMTYREIADRLGVVNSTVCKWLADPEKRREQIRRDNRRRRHKKRQWMTAEPCPECGGQKTRRAAGSDSLCVWCERKRRQYAFRQRFDQVCALRREGLTNLEIASQLGVSEAVVATVIYRGRQHGWPVPVAPYWNRKRAAA